VTVHPVSMADMRELLMGSFGVALVACAASNASGPEHVRVPDVPQPVEVAKVGPAPEIPEPAPVPVPGRPDEEPDTIPLSGAWAATFGHTASYADAIQTVRKARDAFDAAEKPLLVATEGGLPSPVEFQRANLAMDILNRRLAAAYYAPNANVEERIAVLEAAASKLLEWSRRLDGLGLSVTPAAFKADPRLALTFEEVTEGPAKRWRNEGYQLAKLCVERAESEHVDNAATKSCKALHDTYRRVLVREPATAKSKAPAECACNPGDPLCSATMSGWCRPVK
jgi:hypothetical protein